MGILQKFSLDGRAAVVTGASGLYGRQVVAALAEAGAAVYVTTRRPEDADALAARFDAAGHPVTALPVDLAEESSVLRLRDDIAHRAPHVDILVNNAVDRPMADWTDPLSAFAASMRVNAVGLFAITRAFGDLMMDQGRGSIVNVGSIQGMVGPDRSLYEGLGFHGLLPDYFFHKGGMLNFTRFAATYYGPHGVRVNCVSPGGIQSHRTPPDFVERYSRRTALGRMANDSDLMGAIVFLASDASSYVTGANLAVDGGYTAI